MDTHANLGLIPVILLVTFILVGATAASVIMGNQTPESEEELNRIADEAVDEISTYIQYKDIRGKYTTRNNQQEIQDIVLLIKPLVSTQIDLSQLLVQLSNGYDLILIPFNGNSGFRNGDCLFDHPLWEQTTTDGYSALVVLDSDQSILNYHTINDQTDMVYLLIHLPEPLRITNGESVTITLLPSVGTTRTITITAPLPIKPIVNLLE